MAEYYCHPNALVETKQIGEGTKVWAFAHVMVGAEIGANCNIGDHAFVEAGAKVGNGVTIKNNALIWKGVHIADYAYIGPNVVCTNDRSPRSARMPLMKEKNLTEEDWLAETFVEEGASVGANATILAGITLGKYCMVGAGSVVTKDVAPHVLVVGNPAKPVGEVSKSGGKIAER